MGRVIQSVAAAAVAILYTSGVDAKPRVQTGPNAEVTHDGLYRVERSTMDFAWVKPDLDLRPYRKIMLQGTEISFRAVDSEGKTYRPGLDDDTEFFIDDETRERLTQIVRDAFREQLGKSERYELVTARGPRTLLLTGTLIDVVTRMPPNDAYEVYLSSVGEATLVLELRDATTNEVLARAADRRATEQERVATPGSSVTTWSEVRQLANTWAASLRERLDDITVVAD